MNKTSKPLKKINKVIDARTSHGKEMIHGKLICNFYNM